MNKNEFLIEYKINEDDRKIRLFGRQFVSRNGNKCKLVIDNKKLDLLEFIEIDNISKHLVNKNIFKLRLLVINEINDCSKMFCDCKSLLRFQKESKKNINKKFNQNDIDLFVDKNQFYKFKNEDYSYIEEMDSKFSNCESLLTVPDISNIDTTKIKSFHNFFNGCSSLKDIPDISKWNTNNVTNMSGMFNGCKSLISLPDISNLYHCQIYLSGIQIRLL